LQLCCSRLPISGDLFEGYTRDINNWEVPTRSMADPRDKCEDVEVPLSRKPFSKLHLCAEDTLREWNDPIFLGFPIPITLHSMRILAPFHATVME
jgi:hypothetical protein